MFFEPYQMPVSSRSKALLCAHFMPGAYIFELACRGLPQPDHMQRPSVPERPRELKAVKLMHTIVWAFFVSCILCIPITVQLNKRIDTLTLSMLVFGECLVLIFNRWKCPLTNIAERLTNRREDNFDIYLPLWLARWNKVIFGSIFCFAEIYALYRFFL